VLSAVIQRSDDAPIAELANDELDTKTVAYVRIYLGAATEKTMKDPRFWASITIRYITNQKLMYYPVEYDGYFLVYKQTQYASVIVGSLFLKSNMFSIAR
jgi:hypothetical protein